MIFIYHIWLCIFIVLSPNNHCVADLKPRLILDTYVPPTGICHTRLLANVDTVSLTGRVQNGAFVKKPLTFAVLLKVDVRAPFQKLCTIDINKDGCTTQNVQRKKCSCKKFENRIHYLSIRYDALFRRSDAVVKMVWPGWGESNSVYGPPIFRQGTDVDVWIGAERVPVDVGNKCVHPTTLGNNLFKFCVDDVPNPKMAIVYNSRIITRNSGGQRCISRWLKFRFSHTVKFVYKSRCGKTVIYQCEFTNRDKSCTFPDVLRGTFASSTQGELNFYPHYLDGISPCRAGRRRCIPGTILPDRWTCFKKEGDGFHLRSDWWQMGRELYRGHICISFTMFGQEKVTYAIGPFEKAGLPFNDSVLVAAVDQDPNSIKLCNMSQRIYLQIGVLLKKDPIVLHKQAEDCPIYLFRGLNTLKHEHSSQNYECRVNLRNCDGKTLNIKPQRCLPIQFFPADETNFQCIKTIAHEKGNYVILGHYVKRKVNFQCWSIVHARVPKIVLINQAERCDEMAYPTAQTHDMILYGSLGSENECLMEGNQKIQLEASLSNTRKAELPVIIITLMGLTLDL